MSQVITQEITKDVISNADAFVAELQKKLKLLPEGELGITARNTIRESSAEIVEIIDTLKILQAEPGVNTSREYKFFDQAGKSILFKKDTPVEYVTEATHRRLKNAVQAVDKDSHAARALTNSLDRVASEAAEAAAAAEKAKKAKAGTSSISGMIGDITNNHEKWLSKKSQTMRMTIANAEIIVGSILAFQGIHWGMSALSGKKEVAHTEHRPDGKNVTTYSVVPMSSTERTLNAALALGTTSAGIGTTLLGFSALSYNR